MLTKLVRKLVLRKARLANGHCYGPSSGGGSGHCY